MPPVGRGSHRGNVPASARAERNHRYPSTASAARNDRVRPDSRTVPGMFAATSAWPLFITVSPTVQDFPTSKRRHRCGEPNVRAVASRRRRALSGETLHFLQRHRTNFLDHGRSLRRPAILAEIRQKETFEIAFRLPLERKSISQSDRAILRAITTISTIFSHISCSPIDALCDNMPLTDFQSFFRSPYRRQTYLPPCFPLGSPWFPSSPRYGWKRPSGSLLLMGRAFRPLPASGQVRSLRHRPLMPTPLSPTPERRNCHEHSCGHLARRFRSHRRGHSGRQGLPEALTPAFPPLGAKRFLPKEGDGVPAYLLCAFPASRGLLRRGDRGIRNKSAVGIREGGSPDFPHLPRVATRAPRGFPFPLQEGLRRRPFRRRPCAPLSGALCLVPLPQDAGITAPWCPPGPGPTGTSGIPPRHRKPGRTGCARTPAPCRGCSPQHPPGRCSSP